jgi:vacuolar-type H+-ATPase subunit I/STV1
MLGVYSQGFRLTGPGQFLFTSLFTMLAYHFFVESPEPPSGIRDWAIFTGLVLVALSVIFFFIRGWRYEQHIKRHLIEKIFQITNLVAAVLFLVAVMFHISGYKIKVLTPF